MQENPGCTLAPSVSRNTIKSSVRNGNKEENEKKRRRATDRYHTRKANKICIILNRSFKFRPSQQLDKIFADSIILLSVIKEGEGKNLVSR